MFGQVIHPRLVSEQSPRGPLRRGVHRQNSNLPPLGNGVKTKPFNQRAFSCPWNPRDADAQTRIDWLGVSKQFLNLGLVIGVIAFHEGDGLGERLSVTSLDGIGKIDGAWCCGLLDAQPSRLTGSCFGIVSFRFFGSHVRKIRESAWCCGIGFPYFVRMHSQFVVVLVAAFAMSFSVRLSAQSALNSSCDSAVVLSGSVADEFGRWIPSSMVVNRRSGAGEFVGSDGEFLVRACLGDTLVFGAVGYHSQEARVQDGGRLEVWLKVLQVQVGTAEVIAPRTLQEIVRDIQALGYKEEDFRVSGINALQSPITFLYETFSREAQSKRTVARMENDDRRRELLQELFVKYVDYDIVELEPWEFDEFTRFCDPGDDMLKRWSQYEFILYVKQRYQVFRMMPRDLPADELDYHLDKN